MSAHGRIIEITGRPHLQMRNGQWVCVGLSKRRPMWRWMRPTPVTGTGMSPLEAWWNWRTLAEAA